MAQHDFLAAIKARFQEAKTSGGKGWITIPCPRCQRKGAFYVHERLGYKCFRGKCGIRGSIYDFLELLNAMGMTLDYRAGTEEGPVAEVKLDQEEPQQKTVVVDVPLLEEFEPVGLGAGNVPKYFVDRGFEPEMMIKLGFHICRTGKYAARIIVPLLTGPHRTWLAYGTKSREEQPKKVLYPPGCEMSRLLFPYHLLDEIPNDTIYGLVICEGVTDAMRLLGFFEETRFFPLALLGKNLSEHQRREIVAVMCAKHIEEVVVFLDADAEEDMLRVAKRLAQSVGGDSVSVIQWSALPEGLLGGIQQCRYLWPTLDPDCVRRLEHWQRMIELRSSLAGSLLGA